VTENYFVNLLIRMRDEKKLSHEEMLREMPFMFTAANETIALTTSAVLLVLGMYPNIQVFWDNMFLRLLHMILFVSCRKMYSKNLTQYLKKVTKI
jgi:cytochrome P450